MLEPEALAAALGEAESVAEGELDLVGVACEEGDGLALGEPDEEAEPERLGAAEAEAACGEPDAVTEMVPDRVALVVTLTVAETEALSVPLPLALALADGESVAEPEPLLDSVGDALGEFDNVAVALIDELSVAETERLAVAENESLADGVAEPVKVAATLGPGSPEDVTDADGEALCDSV